MQRTQKTRIQDSKYKIQVKKMLSNFLPVSCIMHLGSREEGFLTSK